MGSGGMIVMDEDTCMVDVSKVLPQFSYRVNRVANALPAVRASPTCLSIITRISEGKGKEGDIELLEELAVSTKHASLCALGQTAPNPVLSTLRYFRDEYEAHIKDKRCPAYVCKDLDYVLILTLKNARRV